MFNSFYKYLILHKRVTLPGVGSFLIEHLPSQTDVDTNIIQAPLPAIQFSLEIGSFDSYFFHFLANELQVDEVTAIRRFTNTSYQLQLELNSNGSVVLPYIGTLRKELSHSYSFQPAYSLKDYFPDITAEPLNYQQKAVDELPVVAADETETVIETETIADDKWWIYAVVLAVAGILGIVYYYFLK